ncbi:MAG: geranylgeranylglycerol-phosphate geranylgeranyltransferase [Ignavibacteriaceae bacterium]|nr:geranylgeranylglycerol-phosphate geranylgeranyltransferase [Ignavibacteriaceae bacterium]
MHNYILITRPLNLLITFLSAITGYWLAGGTDYGVMFLAGCSASLIAAGGNVINDIYDLETDRINRPGRPLPSGAIGLNAAFNYYLLLTLSGLILAVRVSYLAFAIAFAVFAGLWLYAYKLKRTALAGNFSVALFTGLVFPYGALAAGDISAGYFPFLFAFLTTLMREVLKDLEDISGDKATGAGTFPVLYGEKRGKVFVRITAAALFLSTLLPFIFGVYKIEFFIIVMIVVNPLAALAERSSWRNSHGNEGYRRASIYMKASMITGLIAIAAGKL